MKARLVLVRQHSRSVDGNPASHPGGSQAAIVNSTDRAFRPFAISLPFVPTGCELFISYVRFPPSRANELLFWTTVFLMRIVTRRKGCMGQHPPLRPHRAILAPLCNRKDERHGVEFYYRNIYVEIVAGNVCGNWICTRTWTRKERARGNAWEWDCVAEVHS